MKCFYCFLCVFVAAAWPLRLDANTPDRQFEEIGLEFVDQFPAFTPIHATWLGDHRYDDIVDDISDESRRKCIAFLRSFEKRLSEIDPQKLSIENRIDHAMLQQRVASEIFAAKELQEWAWNPTLYTGMAGNAIYYLMARDFRPVGTTARPRCQASGTVSSILEASAQNTSSESGSADACGNRRQAESWRPVCF